MAYALLDGAIVPEEEARIPIRDRGFLYGDGCFETIRIHRGAPFRLQAHLSRLRQSLDLMRIGSRASMQDLEDGARRLVAANRTEEGLVRFTITAGQRSTANGFAAITTRDLPAVPPRAALHVASAARRMSGPLSQCKSIARSAESVALREAEAAGAFDSILLNEKGSIAETTARNLFAVTEGALQTPPTYDGALAGITRAAVLELALQEGIRAREVSLSLDRLRAADEVFLTGSGVGVLGIAFVDGHRYSETAPTRALIIDGYARLLDVESKW